MERQITINEKTMLFKSSAATNILYKKAFGEDILVKLTNYAKNLKELKDMQAKLASLKDDETTTTEQKIAVMNEITSSEAFTFTNKFSSETLPRLAYIMYLEANVKVEDIFHKLNEEAYLVWLMGINQDDLLTVTGEVMELWQLGAKTHSKPKN